MMHFFTINALPIAYALGGHADAHAFRAPNRGRLPFAKKAFPFREGGSPLGLTYAAKAAMQSRNQYSPNHLGLVSGTGVPCRRLSGTQSTR